MKRNFSPDLGRPQHSFYWLVISALVACWPGNGMAAAKKKPAKHSGAFTYYLLFLSYAPDFCAEPAGDKDPRECGSGRHIGFVVHRFWPQGENDRGPENCGVVSPVSHDIISATLKVHSDRVTHPT